MEYEIELVVRRYEVDPIAEARGDFPEKIIEVFRDRRNVEAGNLGAAYDIIDDMKSLATSEMDDHTLANCPHDSLAEDEEARMCNVCGVSRAELQADEAEILADLAIDEEIMRRNGDID